MLVAAISGGAVIPPMTGAVATHTGNFHKAMAIPTAFFVLSWVFPVYANFFSYEMLDGHRASDLNIADNHRIDKEVELERQASIADSTQDRTALPQTIETK